MKLISAAHLELIHSLENAIPFLSLKDKEFAASLINGCRQWGRFSDRQLPWVHKLIDRAYQPAPAKAEKLDLTAITAMFDHAKGRGLKRMKIRFENEEGRRFAVSPAQASSKNAGMLYVKNGDTYLGKITQDGEFKGAYGLDNDAVAQAHAALIEFNRDPAGKAKAYGKLTSTCCFCGLGLEDPRSVMSGYGPICAENYGLPIPSMKEAVAWVEANQPQL
jgi:hypothetical protein